MGFFWNWNKQTAAPPVSEPQKKEEAVHAETPKPQPQTEKQAPPTPPGSPPVDDSKPLVEIEMRKLVFRLSSHDPEKCNAFVKEVIRRINRHDWHGLMGRIGKHNDKIKMRIDVKGKHDDIQNFIKWCKVGNFGVHAYEVIETKIYSMPYSEFPPFHEQTSSWPTS